MTALEWFCITKEQLIGGREAREEEGEGEQKTIDLHLFGTHERKTPLGILGATWSVFWPLPINIVCMISCCAL